MQRHSPSCKISKYQREPGSLSCQSRSLAGPRRASLHSQEPWSPSRGHVRELHCVSGAGVRQSRASHVTCPLLRCGKFFCFPSLRERRRHHHPSRLSRPSCARVRSVALVGLVRQSWSCNHVPSNLIGHHQHTSAPEEEPEIAHSSTVSFVFVC